jgi:hypothetical protein
MKYIEEDRAYELYDQMLDETNPEVFGIQPSRILKEMDETAYRCGFVDFLDACDLTTDEDDDDTRVQFGTPEEARGDYDHDVMRQQELDEKGEVK